MFKRRKNNSFSQIFSIIRSNQKILMISVFFDKNYVCLWLGGIETHTGESLKPRAFSLLLRLCQKMKLN